MAVHRDVMRFIGKSRWSMRSFWIWLSTMFRLPLTNCRQLNIALAECAPLRDEGLAFAKKTATSRNPVTVKTWEGMTHTFFAMGAVLDDARLAIEEAAAFLKQSLHWQPVLLTSFFNASLITSSS
ncbi:MAG: alpha/beta hydrolase [Arenicellales bacterium WSBS_2016_MAG_OTU3]